jgi:hypothetical protein
MSGRAPLEGLWGLWEDVLGARADALPTKKSYEVRAGKRLMSFANANTASGAVLEYLCSMGCTRDELARVATNAVSWRGAVYHAVPLGATDD